MSTVTVRTDLARKIGLLLLALWAILFTCGALGELFDLAALKRVADVKQIFLR